MALTAHLKSDETLADRVIKVDHAGEHGAVCVYRAQQWFARWRAPELLGDIEECIEHEIGHRARFAAELARRGRPRCRSYHLCALGGYVLGAITGMAGRYAINATTVAIERIVLRHMREQIDALQTSDPTAVTLLRSIIVEEQQHHDQAAAKLPTSSLWQRLVDPIVAASTGTVIWIGMTL